MRTRACSESLVVVGAAPVHDVRVPMHDGRPGSPLGEALVRVEDGRVTGWSPAASAGAGVARAERDESLLLTPSLMDHHVHGGAGVDLATCSTEQAEHWLRARRAAGVEHVIASLPSLAEEQTVCAVARLEPLWRRGLLAGVHLEGPFLSPDRAGAHPSSVLLQPRSRAGRRLRAWLDGLPRGLLRTMTYAPELDGAAELAAQLRGRGVLACPGHTDADMPTMAGALAAAADGGDHRDEADANTVVTHLFNAMRGFHHRDPGPVPAALAAGRAGHARLELIADGVHVDDALVAALLGDRSLRGALLLVSDAVAATGAGRDDSPLRLGHALLHSRDAVPCLGPGEPDDRRGRTAPTLAGGASSLDAQFLRLLRQGTPVEALVPAVTSVPRRSLDPEQRRSHGWVLWRR